MSRKSMTLVKSAKTLDKLAVSNSDNAHFFIPSPRAALSILLEMAR